MSLPASEPRPAESGLSTESGAHAPQPTRAGTSRRGLVGAGAGLAAGLVAGAGATYAATRPSSDGSETPKAAASSGDANAPQGQVPFRGTHQAGIITAAQDHLHFAALDVTTDDPQALRDLLTVWTRAAERMTYGAEATPGGTVGGGPYKVPTDTGEALDLPPANLTITIGYGPSLFKRFGLAGRKPDALRPLPGFRFDDLNPATCDGDIAIQACADDPQVAVHAVRNLVRLGFGVVAVRWSQLGFGRTSATTTTQSTPRNLFGFKDGTNNLKAENTADLDEHVWVPATDADAAGSWVAGGTYLVTRRIRMHIEVWDRSHLQDQQDTIGRGKLAGEPLGQKAEFDRIDFSAKGIDGQPAIPMRSHIRLAHADNLGGIRILRRGYNFTDGTDGQGHLNAGLFFIAFMRDPQTHFVPMQRELSKSDLLNEYIEHTGSAVFVCPPGLADGQDWGAQLFG